MTIHIPDDLARGLQGIAAAQQKTVEQVALDSLRALFDRASSPEVALRTVRELPHPSAEAVDSQLRIEMHASYQSLEAWIGANVIIRRICLEV